MKELLMKDRDKIVISAKGDIQVKLVLLILESIFTNDKKIYNYVKDIDKLVSEKNNQIDRLSHYDENYKEDFSKEFLYIYKETKVSYNRGTYINRKFFEDVKLGNKSQFVKDGSSGNVFFNKINIKEYRLIKTKEFVIEYGSSLFNNNPENLKAFCDKFENQEEYNILKLLKLIKFDE